MQISHVETLGAQVVMCFGSEFSVYNSLENKLIASTSNNDQDAFQILYPDWDQLVQQQEKQGEQKNVEQQDKQEHQEKQEKKEHVEQQEQLKSQKPKAGRNQRSVNADNFNIRSIASSIDNKLFAIITENKKLVVYDAETWKLLADKFGDAMQYRLCDKNDEFKPVTILGHISILTDIKVALETNSGDNGTVVNREIIVSSDRDEKIRLSYYPNSYNIKGYCMGHTEFVTCLEIPKFAPQVIISGAGDSTCRVWDINSGKNLQTINLLQQLSSLNHGNKKEFGVLSVVSSKNGSTSADSAQPNLVAVIVENVAAVLIYEYNKADMDNSQSPLKLVCLHELPKNNVPVSVCFDNQDHLWVSFAMDTSNLASSLVSVYKYDISSTSLVLAEPTNSSLTTFQTKEIESLPSPTSIFEWGRKSYVRGHNDDDME
ncbi:hypothetical protein BB561_001189 [Smittium simulii]|uniref:Uncharacterized protein n=1 Tax=Smittium simulii TaxID=133385 RepID=A0A2T9YVT9_9FUNG|nr:hypothetical protein BB561_001189 [Smittium simulii]